MRKFLQEKTEKGKILLSKHWEIIKPTLAQYSIFNKGNAVDVDDDKNSKKENGISVAR